MLGGFLSGGAVSRNCDEGMGIKSWGLGSGVAHPVKVIATNAKANNDSLCGLFIEILCGLTGIRCVRIANGI
jgi:hypothetical protein